MARRQKPGANQSIFPKAQMCHAAVAAYTCALGGVGRLEMMRKLLSARNIRTPPLPAPSILILLFHSAGRSRHRRRRSSLLYLIVRVRQTSVLFIAKTARSLSLPPLSSAHPPRLRYCRARSPALSAFFLSLFMSRRPSFPPRARTHTLVLYTPVMAGHTTIIYGSIEYGR